VAVASLSLAHEPVYDAWAWLVWGRELAGLGLDTSSGPSWKPLPVAIATVLSLAGDAAPVLWLLLVRAAWLLALVLAAGLAHRLTPGVDRRLRLAAAACAALTLLLLADVVTSWGRQGSAGMSEPLLVALVLGAVAAALDGRSRIALALALAAALVRPEAWPVLVAHALWSWRAEPASRPWLAAAALAVPALWIVPDLLASGESSAGGRALRGGGAPLHDALEVLWRAAGMPLLAAWPLALLAVASARRRASAADRGVLVLGLLASAWIATVAVMAAAGFPGLPRFMAPAIAIVGVLAGVGLARLPGLAGRPALAVALAAALAACAVQLPGRAAELPRAVGSTAKIARSHDRLRALTQTVERERLFACGKLATSDVLVRTALAWELDVPLSRVVSFGDPPEKSGAFVAGPQATPAARAALRQRGVLLGARGEWRLYSINCASARRTGVSGARR
jgi:hypothetical protein